MSRSVSRPPEAEIVCFQEYEGDDLWDWECYVDDIVDTCQYYWPSLEKADRWIGRENHVLLENRHAQIGVSIYGLLVSVWIVPQKISYNRWAPDVVSPLALHWIDQIEGRFRECFARLQSIGRFSNGEEVFRRIE